MCVTYSMFLMTKIMKRTQKYFISQQTSLGNVNGHIEEMYGAHQVVKAFNGEEIRSHVLKTIMMIYITLHGNHSSFLA